MPTKGKKALIVREGDELATAIYSASGWEENSEGDEGENDSDLPADSIQDSESEAEEAEDEGLEEDSPVQEGIPSGHSLFIVTKYGRVLRFSEESVRQQGRTSLGVKSISLRNGDKIVALTSDTHGSELVIITENGFGTRMKLDEFSVKGRRGQGVIGMRVNEKIGPVAAALIVEAQDQIMISTAQGVVVRISVKGIGLRHRSAGGVKAINVAPGDKVIRASYVVTKDEEEDKIPLEDEFEGVTALGTEEASESEQEANGAPAEGEAYDDFYENLPEESFTESEGDPWEEDLEQP